MKILYSVLRAIKIIITAAFCICIILTIYVPAKEIRYSGHYTTNVNANDLYRFRALGYFVYYLDRHPDAEAFPCNYYFGDLKRENDYEWTTVEEFSESFRENVKYDGTPEDFYTMLHYWGSYSKDGYYYVFVSDKKIIYDSDGWISGDIRDYVEQVYWSENDISKYIDQINEIVINSGDSENLPDETIYFMIKNKIQGAPVFADDYYLSNAKILMLTLKDKALYLCGYTAVYLIILAVINRCLHKIKTTEKYKETVS